MSTIGNRWQWSARVYVGSRSPNNQTHQCTIRTSAGFSNVGIEQVELCKTNQNSIHFEDKIRNESGELFAFKDLNPCFKLPG
jgi:hypothetical protein